MHNALLAEGRGLLGLRDRVRRQRGDARPRARPLAHRPHRAEGGWMEGIDPRRGLLAAGVADPLASPSEQLGVGPRPLARPDPRRCAARRPSATGRRRQADPGPEPTSRRNEHPRLHTDCRVAAQQRAGLLRRPTARASRAPRASTLSRPTRASSSAGRRRCSRRSGAVTGRDSIEGLRLIDLGCGFGALAVFFAGRGATVTGIDPIADRLEVGSGGRGRARSAGRVRPGPNGGARLCR